MNRPHFRRRPRPTDPDPSVIATEAPGGDLAAMAAPLGMDWGVDWRYVDALPGMARDDLGTYAEPVEVHIEADVSAFCDAMDLARSAVWSAAGWEESTRAFDRIMDDLRGLNREIDVFADGRAYETGSRCRTDSAALRRATEHLADGQDGARRAALVLAGFTGAEAWAV